MTDEGKFTTAELMTVQIAQLISLKLLKLVLTEDIQIGTADTWQKYEELPEQGSKSVERRSGIWAEPLHKLRSDALILLESAPPLCSAPKQSCNFCKFLHFRSLFVDNVKYKSLVHNDTYVPINILLGDIFIVDLYQRHAEEKCKWNLKR